MVSEFKILLLVHLEQVKVTVAMCAYFHFLHHFLHFWGRHECESFHLRVSEVLHKEWEEELVSEQFSRVLRFLVSFVRGVGSSSLIEGVKSIFKHFQNRAHNVIELLEMATIGC